VEESSCWKKNFAGRPAIFKKIKHIQPFFSQPFVSTFF